MKRKYKSKPKQQIDIAKSRMEGLFKQADKVFGKSPKLADRYVELARKISMKYKIRIPSMLKKRFCKHCHCFLKQGVNCRARLNKGKLVYYCLNCRHYMRFPYKR